jgi:hypothetical protein
LSQNSSTAIATLIAGTALLMPASVGLLASGVGTVLCPFPLITVLPAFWLSNFGVPQIAVVAPALLFFLWQPKLFQGEVKIPKRSYVLLIVLILLSIADFVGGWKWGLEYQGPQFTHAVLAINLVWIVFLISAFLASLKSQPRYRLNVFLHWILFAWLAWYAFPYMGELP